MDKGLSEEKVFQLKKQFGENILPVKEGTSWPLILLSQFKSPLIYILLLVGLISLFLGEYINVILIGAVVVLNVFMGFFQEYNAKKTLLALRKILKPITTVIRNGVRKKIESRELVPGDLVVLGSGDKVPADGQLVKGTNLLVNEAILTGEGEAVEKNLQEKSNFLFMGTVVVSGNGTMRVMTVGQETKIGQIGQSLAEIREEKTPLEIKLEGFTKQLAKIVLVICLLIFLIGLGYQRNLWETLKVSIVLSVAAIPEGLPIAMTVVLVLGMRRILKRNGLVKKLISVETLGSTSVICTDKTGTLTEGVMKVVKTEFVDQAKALVGLIAINNQKTNLEVCLWGYASQKRDLIPKEILDSITRIFEEPFDSEKKYSLVISKVQGKETGFVAGAPEIVLSFCHPSPQEKNKIIKTLDSWASKGLKVFGIAIKETGDLKEKKGYSWLGSVGLEDPLREGVKEAIVAAQRAGIKIKIVTGDFRKTAEKIALDLGFKLKPENILEGEELEAISEDKLKEKIENLLLFTRVTPHQKLKIVKSLQEKGETVAMTGDGVNDAPALKMADIGVVLGSGSDVAKEAGDLILLDNNFKTIVSACEEGRLIFSNLKKVVGYALSNSFAEIILIFGAMLLNLSTPLTVIQILWINLICDGPPDILLSFEPKEKSLMEERPKNLIQEEILSQAMKLLILVISLTTGIASLLLFRHFLKTTGDLNLSRTIVFATMSTTSLFYIFSFKNLKKIIFQTENFFQNKYLFLGLAYGLLLVMVAIYTPGLNRILGMTPLRVSEWILVLGIILMITFLIEIVKFLSNLSLRKN
ncbi:MAG: Ca2+-transporting ATPase [Microgenomates group bacterium LiPW_31]|nr:MAG: Ca2+-transporting ATPase [Microgenomates group bacterium LiPW_31]